MTGGCRGMDGGGGRPDGGGGVWAVSTSGGQGRWQG
jgi:hypothetical protein